ncbi:hypothetical protein [Pedobacter sp. Leaf194]|uniref:hypothetical protein n=1 Tax=Pedobacter sp. Leaf194 TaxID=1736297 RepID=UPI0007027973|nr:hypothetical protein [Pedobacter sp. Leaf194]KQS36741.1 hypothetical protein ASG14_06790 [Pedobacter sp. Leaf194]
MLEVGFTTAYDDLSGRITLIMNDEQKHQIMGANVFFTSNFRVLLSIILIVFAAKTSGQTLTDFKAPAGFKKVLETHGDLDKDGVEEVAFAYNSTKKDSTGFKRVLYICKTINGSLKLWKQNTSVLWNSSDCGFCFENGVTLALKIKNNTLIVEQTYWHNSRHTSMFRNVFRYQNSDWFLIGSTYNDRYNCGFDHTYDINFSTKNVHIDYDGEDCDDGTPQFPKSTKNFKYPFKAIPKMDGFIAGKVELKIPNSKQYFYY